jgi:quinol monooxygenase YgiN
MAGQTQSPTQLTTRNSAADYIMLWFPFTKSAGQKNGHGKIGMTTKALFVRLEAKPGKENEVAKFLRDGQGLVAQEPATTAWFGLRLGQTSFAIFDAFPDDAGRDAHLSGNVAKALMEKAPELLAEPPKIEKADVLADMLPG